MRVIRLYAFEGPEDAIRRQLGGSIPAGGVRGPLNVSYGNRDTSRDGGVYIRCVAERVIADHKAEAAYSIVADFLREAREQMKLLPEWNPSIPPAHAESGGTPEQQSPHAFASWLDLDPDNE